MAVSILVSRLFKSQVKLEFLGHSMVACVSYLHYTKEQSLQKQRFIRHHHLVKTGVVPIKTHLRIQLLQIKYFILYQEVVSVSLVFPVHIYSSFLFHLKITREQQQTV